MLEQDIQEILLTREQIAQKVQELGAQITKDYQGKAPLLVCVLRGSLIFVSDLMRAIDLKCTVDFMAVSSYGSGTESSGELKMVKDLNDDITGRDVIVVEDILDTGNTLSRLLTILEGRNPASLKLCTLLNKPARRVTEVKLDYVGYSIEDYFVVGYGLDYNEVYRNLPYVGVLKPEVYR